MNFTAGSKTFLVGEYSVLYGGCAVVLITPPAFELRAAVGETSLLGIEKESPAFRFYESHDFADLAIEFIDPHNGSGGFGASSAQFVMLYQLYLQLTKRQFDIDLFLNEYKALSECSGRVVPSGADCIAQYFNHHIFFDSQTNNVEKLNWEFPHLDFAIFKTKHKIATHLHLKELRYMDIAKLQRPILNVKKSFLDNNEQLLIKNTQDFFNFLKDDNLIIDQNIKTVAKLFQIDGVKVAKGCGACGADTILVIFEKQKSRTLRHIMHQVVQGNDTSSNLNLY
jgi:mevalonate kinase